MSKPALGAIPFENKKPLAPDSPALSKEVYADVHDQFPRPEMITCVPKVICSPKRTGKTTLVYQICQLQREISDLIGEEECQVILADGFEREASEALLRATITERLDSPKDSETLVDMIQQSRVVNRSANMRVLMVIMDADQLSNGALRWLLYNVRELYENPRIPAALRFQVLIDGSFSVETITSPDSQFPLPQLFPRDFRESEQRQFVGSRLAQLNLRLSSGGYKVLWQTTFGDKYLTQAICLVLSETFRSPSKYLTISSNQVSASVETYLQSDPMQDPLKKDWLRAFASLSDRFEANESDLEAFLKRMPEQWQQQTREIRLLAYQGGLVRRTLTGALETRPLVQNVFDQAKARVAEVRSILNSSFSLEDAPEITNT